MKKTVWIVLFLLLSCISMVVAQADKDDDEGDAGTPAKSTTAKETKADNPAPAKETTPPPSPSVAPSTPDTTKTTDKASTTPALAPTDEKQSNSPAGSGSPIVVKTSMFLRNIGKFDQTIGKYTAEFEVEFKVPENTPNFAGNFDILNGRIVKKEEIKGDNPLTRHFKIEAEIDLDLDFKRFPWDSQDLSITLYNPEMDSTEMKYEVDPLAKDESRMDEKVKLVGWHIEEDESAVSEDSFMEAKEKYSMFTFGLEIHRMRYAATMKVFFPLTIMVFISFLALFIGAGAAVNRLTILTGTLLAAVMFHLNASSALPPIGYLTLADKVFFCSYVSFLLNLILTVVLLKYNEFKLEEKVKSSYSIALILVPVVTILSWGLAFAGII